MANTITAIVPTVIARGLLVLRENAVMPRLVNTQYSAEAARKGQVINIPLPSALVVTNVTAGATPPTPQNSAPTTADVTLNQHKRIDFALTDREILEIDADAHFIPGQVSEAMKKLANTVDTYIFTNGYKTIHNYGGTAGTTPFATNLTAFKLARLGLNKDAVSTDDRRVVLDADAEANALDLSKFLDANVRGDQGGIIGGTIGRKIGADWYLDQNVITHTAGTWAITGTGYNEVKAAATAGTSTLIVQGNSSTTTNGGNVKIGDVFKVTGDTQGYAITADASVAVGAQSTLSLTFRPVLRATIAAGATLLWGGGSDNANHQVNLLFHRDYAAFASRPLEDSVITAGAGATIQTTASDPVTGLSMRLEIIRQYKQWMWDFDMLYGSNVVRPEMAARILG